MDKIYLNQLVAETKAGSRCSSEELLERYDSLIWYIAKRMYLPCGEPEDLVQEGRTGLWQAVLIHDGVRDFHKLANTLIKRRMIDAVRKSTTSNPKILNKALLEEPDGLCCFAGDLSDTYFQAKDREDIKRFILYLESLTTTEEECLVLHIKGYNNIEISKETGYRMKTIDNALQRAKKKWREKGKYNV